MAGRSSIPRELQKGEAPKWEALPWETPSATWSWWLFEEVTLGDPPSPLVEAS